MKLKFWLDKSIDNKNVSPRYIRNLILAMLEKAGHIQTIPTVANKVKIENSQSNFIYLKPRARSFEVISYNNDLEALSNIEEVLLNQEITILDKKVKVLECNWDEEAFRIPQKTVQLKIYNTRTPIVISVNEIEHKIVYNKARSNDNQMQDYIAQKIRDVIVKQYKDIFNKDFEGMEDFSIKLLEWNKITVNAGKYEKGKFNQAVYCKFVSNYSLPRLVGYSTGMGYGELLDNRSGVSFKKR